MDTEEYIDSEGRKWISPAKVAEIWNERARAEGLASNYTRWSVRSRRSALTSMQTPLGHLYLESEARTIPLRPRATRRPDVAQRNRARGQASEKSTQE